MAKKTAIEWADATWNPWRGCTKISDGCKNCYMFRDQKRFGRDPEKIVRSKTTFNDPAKWLIPARIFVCSWSDFFHEDVPVEWRNDAWEIMRQNPEHTYMILTKRPQNIREMLPDDWGDGWPHVWLGVTVENYNRIHRLQELLVIPMAVAFVSFEPLLSGIPAIEPYLSMIDWAIVGGESGPNARAMNPHWVINLRDQCLETETAFFFKQWGGKRKDPNGTWGGNLLDGQVWHQLPISGKDE